MPSIHAPWYVVMYVDPAGLVTWYREFEMGRHPFTHVKKDALIMTDLRAATRVAAAENGWVRVLTSKFDAEEFGKAE